MSDHESSNPDAAFSLPLTRPQASPSPAREPLSAMINLPPPEVTATSDLADVSKILKSTADSDPLEDKEQFYPLQQKTAYMPPVTTLTSDSKRIIRQAQAPILQASPRVVHFLYEVCFYFLSSSASRMENIFNSTIFPSSKQPFFSIFLLFSAPFSHIFFTLPCNLNLFSL